ncbi:MAG: hypothetical protein EOO54_10625 [Haliea sp.]|nr:MAG: hypothetical protein EOO54_10625 [Haliea sp.]
MDESDVFGGRSASARTVVVYGNCQAPVLARRLSLLTDLNDDYRFLAINRHLAFDPAQSGFLPDGFPQGVALLLEQYEDHASRNPLRMFLHERLPAGCPVITYPSFAMNSMWPFECPDPRCPADTRFPYGRYQGDFIAMQVAHAGLRGGPAIAAYLDLSARKMPNLEVRLQRDLHRMQHYDASCDVPLADYVERSFRDHHLFGTAGHVSDAAITELARRVMDAARRVLGGTAQHLEAMMAGQPGMPLQAPIHPMAADQLGLKFWTADLVYRWYSQAWTHDEYLGRYIENDSTW